MALMICRSRFLDLLEPLLDAFQELAGSLGLGSVFLAPGFQLSSHHLLLLDPLQAALLSSDLFEGRLVGFRRVGG